MSDGVDPQADHPRGGNFRCRMCDRPGLLDDDGYCETCTGEVDALLFRAQVNTLTEAAARDVFSVRGEFENEVAFFEAYKKRRQS